MTSTVLAVAGPTPRRKPPNAGKGRVKGVPNKTTASVKAALEEAFTRMGGVPALVKWAAEEPAEFYKIWSKLIPADMKLTAGDGTVGLTITVTHE